MSTPDLRIGLKSNRYPNFTSILTYCTIRRSTFYRKLLISCARQHWTVTHSISPNTPNCAKPPAYENSGGVSSLRLSPYTVYYLACTRIYRVLGQFKCAKS